MAIAHQVFAAYRRADRRALVQMFERAKPFEAAVHEAAAAFGIDPEVMMGVAAAESSFRPRTSGDGGRGLFQITAPPAGAGFTHVPILSYASASYVDRGHAGSGRVVLRSYVVISEDGSTADVQKLLEEAWHDSPVCSLLADSAECRADIRRLCGTCAR